MNILNTLKNNFGNTIINVLFHCSDENSEGKIKERIYIIICIPKVYQTYSIINI